MPDVDFSLGLQCMANVEGVTYTSRRTAGDMVDRIEGVMRRALNSREGSPSGGVYTVADVAFMIPREKIASLLLQDRAPKEGDLITDDAGVEFVAQNVNGLMRGRNGYELYKVQARDLVLAYDLRDTIDIEAPAMVSDGAGVGVKAWPPGQGSVPYASLPCRVQAQSQELSESFGITAIKGSYAVIVGRQVKLNYEWRIRWVDAGVVRYLDIVDVKNPERVDELPVIGCVLNA